MGGLSQSWSDVSVWTNHKWTQRKTGLQSSSTAWRFAVLSGIDFNVICFRPDKALCDIRRPVGYRDELLLLSHANRPWGVFLSSTVIGERHSYCW